MKQTAVEFIEQHLFLDDNWRRIFQQAKEMEKQQIIDAHISGMEFIAVDPNHYNNDSEQYYNETFKKK